LFNSYRDYERVVPACSSSVHHAFGRDDKTDTQQPRRLFSTPVLAWKALRNETEKRFAKELAKIDIEIQKLEAT
jgi:hypothetical protein